MFYVGILLLIWLAIGFILGIKVVFVDQLLKENEDLESFKQQTNSEERQLLELMIKNKWVVIAILTLSGGYGLFQHIKTNFTKNK
ncbi:hypothetical protein [Heyndrickxia camelliae]|uniref:Uncharacterized protein n=1 Tax=Heyndrickxia camelliae TaxID=1707093 RepID=A0A2N3LEQ7_9BACI|nr:hypothetical protein [Heyndrickxia camelliae]PKR83033.1 hypothetical protein CWO92_21070 [Heyndrickxia camelliae]